MKTDELLKEYLQGTGLDEVPAPAPPGGLPDLPDRFFAPAWEPDGIPEGMAVGCLTGQELAGLMAGSLVRGDLESMSVASLRAELISMTRRLGVYEQWLAEGSDALAVKDQALAAKDDALAERKRELKRIRNSTAGKLARISGRLSRQGRRLINGIRRGG